MQSVGFRLFLINMRGCRINRRLSTWPFTTRTRVLWTWGPRIGLEFQHYSDLCQWFYCAPTVPRSVIITASLMEQIFFTISGIALSFPISCLSSRQCVGVPWLFPCAPPDPVLVIPNRIFWDAISHFDYWDLNMTSNFPLINARNSRTMQFINQ